MSVFAKIKGLFSKQERFHMAGLFLLMLLGSGLEIFGVGLLLPLAEVARDPEILLSQPQIGDWFESAGLTDDREVIIAISSLFLTFFVAKTIAIALLWRVLFGMVFEKTVALSKRLLAAYLRTRYAFHLRRNTSELIRNATTEVNNLMSGVVMSYMFLASEIVVATGLGVLLAIANPWAAVAGLLGLGTIGWAFTSLLQRRITRIGQVRAEQQARMIQWVNQSLGGVKEIKVLGREGYFVNVFAESGAAYADAQRQNMLLSQYPRLAIEGSMVVGLVGLIIVLLLTGSSLADTIPTVAIFAAAAVRLIPSFTRIVTSVNSLRYYYPSVDIVYRDLTEAEKSARKEEEKAARALDFRDSITLEQVTYLYEESRQPAVHDVSMIIRRGRATAFVGPSGAGKTTLANLILGLLEPSSGRILVDSVDIAENLSEWRRRLGYIPQDAFLSDDSLRRNVAFGVPDGEIDDQAVWRALDLAQLAEFVRSLDEGLDTFVGERGIRISGGQRQRLGIARALYHDPEVLLLDEATSALDHETEREIKAAIYGLLKTKTLIVIAHRLSTIRNCDVIYVLDRGRVAGAGKYGELAADNATFQQLVQAAGASAVDALRE